MWKLAVVALGLVLMPAGAWAAHPAEWVQEHFRWRNDDGDASAATWKTVMDTAVTNVARYRNIRLRFCMANTSTDPDSSDSIAHTLQYAVSTNGPWTDVSSATNGAYAFEAADSPYYVNRASAGNLLTWPGTYVEGNMMTEYPQNIVGGSGACGPLQYGNCELCFRPNTKARGATTYYFRLKEGDTTLSTTATPQYAALTMAPGDVAEAPKIVSPLVASVAVDRANQGPAMSYQLLASGSDPIAYEATGLPAGYALFENVITEDGTPSMPGTYNVTLTARNAYGSDTKTLALTVLADHNPEITLKMSAEVGKPFSYTIHASGNGPMSNLVTRVGSSELPYGLSFDGTNTIYGVPMEAGTSKLRIKTVCGSYVGYAANIAIILTMTGSGGGADADGDGMTDAWEIQNFGSTNAAADADADADGMTNLAEFKAGTIPTDAGSVLAIGAVGTAGTDKFVVSWDSVSDKNYGVDKRTNLTGGAWQPTAAGIQGNPPVNTYTDSVGTIPSAYYRVTVE